MRIARPAPAGIVTTQLTATSRTVLRFRAPMPDSPTQGRHRQGCVVEIGNASQEAITMVVAAPNSAAHDWESIR